MVYAAVPKLWVATQALVSCGSPLKKIKEGIFREEIILLAAKIIISDALCNEKYTEQIGNVPLSNKTVKKRIDEMTNNMKTAMITALLQSKFFALQLDETTDVANWTNLSCFVRF